MDNWGAKIVENNKKRVEVCVNADEVVRSIKNAFPGETSESLARRAGVSFQTVQRWISSGRADGTALRRLLAAFPAKKTSGDKVYLDKATPEQLYDRCSAVGWDVVIQAGKKQ